MSDGRQNLSFLGDVQLKLSVSVGKTSKFFQEILGLEEGDVIELEKNKEEYVDIFLGDQPFALGEIVVVNEKFSVRIIDLA